LRQTKAEGVFLDTRVNIIDAFSALVTSDSYNVSRFFSADFDKKLKDTLQSNKFDFVHLESLFLTPYIGTIKKYSGAKVILRSHNLEHLIWERLANLEGNKAKRIYLKHLSKKLKKYENNVLNDVDGIAAISFEDTKRYNDLNCKVPLITVPFGIDLDNYVPVAIDGQKKIRLFHIGSMDWNPNIEAINWFLDDIYPILDLEKIELHLAGKNMPDYIKKLESDTIKIHGMVPSALKFMAKYDVMIVPLLSGSGMRIKIIEAMAMGKTVITTKVGLEGISATHNFNVLIADTTNEFKSIIEDLELNPKRIIEIGKNARMFIEKNHNNNVIMKSLISFYKSL
jgi:glycosyltransferase involved in cell wall biosynthesis